MRIDDLAQEYELERDDVIGLLELAACCGIPPYTPEALLFVYIDGEYVKSDLEATMGSPRQLSAPDGFVLAVTIRSMMANSSTPEDGLLESVAQKLESALGKVLPVTVAQNPVPWFAQIKGAIESQLQVEIEYFSLSTGSTSSRVIEPLYLFSEQGNWYVDAYCHKANGYRHFRIDRIRKVTILDTPVTAARRQSGFFEDSTSVFLKVTASQLPMFDRVFKKSISDSGDGTFVVEIPLGSRVWLDNFLLILGAGAKVLSPEDLCDRPLQAARELLRIYGQTC